MTKNIRTYTTSASIHNPDGYGYKIIPTDVDCFEIQYYEGSPDDYTVEYLLPINITDMPDLVEVLHYLIWR